MKKIYVVTWKENIIGFTDSDSAEKFVESLKFDLASFDRCPKIVITKRLLYESLAEAINDFNILDTTKVKDVVQYISVFKNGMFQISDVKYVEQFKTPKASKFEKALIYYDGNSKPELRICVNKINDKPPKAYVLFNVKYDSIDNTASRFRERRNIILESARHFIKSWGTGLPISGKNINWEDYGLNKIYDDGTYEIHHHIFKTLEPK